ncbi:unnamed protein product [Pylaiella littoralis]
MERFLPSAGGSSAAGLKPCGEPTCQSKSTLVSGVHQCPCGRFMHAFCGRGIGGEGFGQQRECSDCQKRKAAGGYKTEMVIRLAALIEDWDTVRARKIRKGCRGLSDAGQATMLDVTEILSQKWESFSDQTIVRCWLKATILPREHEDALKGRDTRLDREDKDAAALDDLCDMVKKMSMPESAKGLDARSMPRLLSDNLFVESASGLTEQEVRSAVETWLSVEDDEEVLREEVELEMEEVTENISRVAVENDASSEEEDQDGRQESCMKSTISEAEVRSRLEDVRSYLYANGNDGEYSETVYLLSKTVHSFTHETQVKRRAKEGGEVQATLRDMWAT